MTNRRGRTFSRGFHLWLALFALCLLGTGRVLIDLFEFAMLSKVPVVAPTATARATWDDLSAVEQAAALKINPDVVIERSSPVSSSWAVVRLPPRTDHWAPVWVLVPIADLSPAQLERYLEFTAAERQEIGSGFVNFAMIGFGVPLLVGCVGFLGVRVGRWVRAGWR